ncbi:cupin domain-containing protein [Streptomyces sp. NPDC102467]|uniref:cupin domain-containing protein n=1 Tax=Streptomyces sp. NPDC102467 TaxID=3366179 RepID=UPI0038097FDC
MTTQANEQIYFPDPDIALNDEGARFESYRRKDTEVTVIRIPPHGSFAVSAGDEARVGMVVKGELSVTVGGVTKSMTAECDVYVAPPGVDLSIANTSPEEVVALEIRRDQQGGPQPAPSGYFLEPYESRKFVGMDVTFFVNNWIELMLADIPSGGEMPYHKHSHEQIGICLEGRYEMTVEETSHELAFGGTYFCASQEGHGAVNPNAGVARSLNIFIPPRYHRVSKLKNDQEAQ